MSEPVEYDPWPSRDILRARAEKARRLNPEGEVLIPVNVALLLSIIDKGKVAADGVAKVRAQRNAARYDATLLAKALVDTGAAAGSVTPVIERHYRRGELEPNGDTIVHPWRMTPELAESLTLLMVLTETGSALSGIAREITDELQRQHEVG